MSGNGALIVALVVFVLGIYAIRAQANVDIAYPLRNWFNARDVQRMQARGALPETVERRYWTLREYRKDAARYTALGYEVVSEQTNEPYEVNPHVAEIYTTMRTPLASRNPPRRRVPVAHIVYGRR